MSKRERVCVGGREGGRKREINICLCEREVNTCTANMVEYIHDREMILNDGVIFEMEAAVLTAIELQLLVPMTLPLDQERKAQMQTPTDSTHMYNEKSTTVCMRILQVYDSVNIPHLVLLVIHFSRV